MKKIGLYWFSHDLRIDDNLALATAAQEVDALLCIAFISHKNRNQFHPIPVPLSKHRLSFLVQSLDDLDQSLQTLGQHLFVSENQPEVVIPELINDHAITHLYLSDDGFSTKESVVQSIMQQFPSLTLRKIAGNRLYHEQDLPFSIEELPSTFSKFRRKVEKIATQTPYHSLQQLPHPITQPIVWQDKFHEYLTGGQWQFYGGESAGNKHLKSYFQGEHASTYKLTRNALDGIHESTKFSPWLANGCLSVRRVIERLHRYEEEVMRNESTYWIFFELLWREYFQWYEKCYKDKLFLFSGIKGYKPITSFYPERFRKWCEGNTPFAIVNACMKQLNATGYMSNRGRQLVASCLVNELSLDWRYGAAYMEQYLIDYDTGSNWGNWQYLAGVGADPRGLRRFDLDKQTQRYDPQQTFIKQWQPDTAHTPLDSTDAADWPIINKKPLKVSA